MGTQEKAEESHKLISKIKVSNFKSFSAEAREVELGNFNVLIGANASGKSNFIEALQFLKNIATSGLENAVSMHGSEYLRNMHAEPSQDLAVEITSDLRHAFTNSELISKSSVGIKVDESNYKFSLRFTKEKQAVEITKDELKQACTFVRLKKGKERRLEEKGEYGKGFVNLRCDHGEVKINVRKPQGLDMETENITPIPLSDWSERPKQPHALLLERPIFKFVSPLSEMFKDLSIYNFDPKASRQAAPITGKAELEEDGRNLPIVLQNILEDKESERKLSNLVADLLPFIDKFRVEKKSEDKSLLFKLREKYFKKRYLPAFLLSDGTINVTNMIVALFFEEKPLTVIEEPEKNIHPHIISKLVALMKDASRERQIIITTHNPEVIKHAGLENILLISRDEKGFSKISRPSDKARVRAFLENEMGIADLYVQNEL